LEQTGKDALDGLLNELSDNEISDAFRDTLEQRKAWFSEPDLPSLISTLQSASDSSDDAKKLLKRLKANATMSERCGKTERSSSLSGT